MTTKEYLSQIYLLNVKVKTKRQQAAELRNSIAGISGNRLYRDKGADNSDSEDAGSN